MTEAGSQPASGGVAAAAAPASASAKPAVLPDPVYEFSAPRYYDFATNSQDLPSSERADAWFDTAGTSCKYGVAHKQLSSSNCKGQQYQVCLAALTSPAAKTIEEIHAQQTAATKAAGDSSAEAVPMVRDSHKCS